MNTSFEKSFDMDEQEQIRQKLLWNVKREVKQMMEEAVMKKCIHEENCSITTLSAAVEACLLHGLKRRAVGLFKTSTTMALLQKIARSCPAAGDVVKIVDEDSRSHDEPSNIFSLSRKFSIMAPHPNTHADDTRARFTRSALYSRYLWIRTALIHRSLHQIVDYIVNNSIAFYEPYALVCNSVEGPIFSSLLVGPCALEFTRVKTSDHLWTDPHADELVQRHRMHSNQRAKVNPITMMMNTNNTHASTLRPSLHMNSQRHHTAAVEETQRTNSSAGTSTNPAREYVESLHQNARSQLIYGKNNVFVQPIPSYDPIPGYLSLHHNHHGLTLKWTPNQLMNGYSEHSRLATSNSQGINELETDEPVGSPKKFSVYWDYAVTMSMSSIVYLHCHQHVDGDRIVFIGRDGVQYPPFHIKDKGGHLLAFLTCLESGLAPNGQLDPPLWYEKEQGKIFPKLYRRTEHQSSVISPNTSADDEEIVDNNGQTQPDKLDEDPTSPTGDYVFRIIFLNDHETVSNATSERGQWPVAAVHPSSLSSQSSLSPPAGQVRSLAAPSPASPSDSAFDAFALNVSPTTVVPKSASIGTSLTSLCDTMRRQILSRAFYGWLTYCRHLRTVRTHLAFLVNPISKSEQDEQLDSTLSLTFDSWNELFLMKQAGNLPIDKKEIYQRIYMGGCEPSIRKQVWPYLFSHYSFESTIDERNEVDRKTIERYSFLTSEWQKAESVVVQIDLQLALCRKNAIKKVSQPNIESVQTPTEKTLASIRTALANFPHRFSIPNSNTLERKDSSMSNDVFYEDCAVHTVNLPIAEESSRATTPRGEHPFLSSSSNHSVLVARTRTESVIDRSSPYNIVDTSTEIEDDLDYDDSDDDVLLKSVDDDSEQVALAEQMNDDEQRRAEQALSPSSSLTSGTDVYMDAIDIIHDDSLNDASDGSMTPIYYGTFSQEIIDAFSTNIHRIDKDVARCDRNYSYFTNNNNLKKLRNIMCTYVWDNLATGYIQGMCDLVAPLLVIFDEEVIAYSCFCHLMRRLLPNFPHGAGMDEHFGHMRSLLQILDFQLYEHIHRTGDFTHFYFCYRWLLLDFKREFVYDDIFLVWETIAAARRTVSKRFVLFIALAMLKSYRDIILDNRMDFTDIIRFFNEMAERHNAREILRIARELVLELQKLIDNK